MRRNLPSIAAKVAPGSHRGKVGRLPSSNLAAERLGPASAGLSFDMRTSAERPAFPQHDRAALHLTARSAGRNLPGVRPVPPFAPPLATAELFSSRGGGTDRREFNLCEGPAGFGSWEFVSAGDRWSLVRSTT